MENKNAVSVGEACLQPISDEGKGKCPVCGSPLYYSQNGEAVECPYCSATVETDKILPVSKPLSCVDYAMEIESPVAALVYLETFFKSYDWETYMSTARIAIPEIDGLVKKIRIKFGDNTNSWILDFESRITPFLKKLEALSSLEAKFISDYDGKVSDEINSAFILYSAITEEIKASVEKIFDALKTDIEYAERLGESEEAVKELKNRFNEAAELYTAGVHDFATINEIPAIQIAKDALDRKRDRALHDSGIDAEATYKKAKALYESQKNKENALRLFEAIRGYRDSDKYIARINEFFNFDSKLIKLAGKHFLLKKVAAPVFNVDKPAELENPTEESASESAEKKKPEIPKIPIKGVGPTVSLYEVIDGRTYEPAVVTGISFILSYYGNKIFYVKKNRSLCSYDVHTRIETELDRGAVNDYPREKIYWNSDKTAFFIRKKLPAFKAERGGCFRAFFSIFKRRPERITDTKNNYSLIKVDTVANTVSEEIDRLVDITECYDDRLFYISYLSAGLPSFRVCDLRTGKKTSVLGDDCHIHNVMGDNVIYTTWDPNEYNKMLFSYNLATDSTTLIEANIYDYFASLGDRVYYRVGNKKRAPIFSNNLEGSDRLELIDDIREVYASFDSWIYLVRGKGRNTTLFKMSKDKKTVLQVASDISAIISMTESYTYYIDSKGVLHAVDNDGAVNRAIIDDIDTDNLIIDKNYIYFLRREPVGRDKNAASLYRVDIDGRNIKKLLFNVNKIQNYDEKSIYVYRSALTKYVATEKENDLVKSEKQVKYRVTRFYVLDKKTELETEIAALGLPDDKDNLEKRGCFRRNIRRSVTYREISNKISYKKTDIAKVGEIFTEQTEMEIPEI